MWRTLSSFEAEVLEWENCGCTSLSDMSPSMIQGRSVYAAKQASIHRGMAEYCCVRWELWLEELKDGQGGIALEDEVWKFV